MEPNFTYVYGVRYIMCMGLVLLWRKSSFQPIMYRVSCDTSYDTMMF